MVGLRLGGRQWGTAVLAALLGLGCNEGEPSSASGTDSSASDDTNPGSSGDSTDGDDGSSTGEPPPVSECDDEIRVGNARMRLLTRYEYDNTVFALLGDDSAPAQTFPPENQSTAFENNAADHQVTKDTVRRYLDVAEDLAETSRTTGFAELASALPCEVSSGDAACGSTFIADFGARAFRRPLASEELQLFEDLFTTELAANGFEDAIATTLQAILQSPQFLYRIEMVPEDAQPGDIVAVTDHELASRLSYFLAATTPDTELLAAADAGQLHTLEQLETHARRILQTPGARSAVRHFHRQWLGLSALQSVTKDPELYPGLDTTTVAADWSQSVQDFTEHVVFDGEGTLDELLGSDKVFLSPALASFYGATPNGDGSYAVEGDRAGLLTQPALMALYAYPDRSSPIARGVWVRQRMLCQTLPPPPDDVDIEPPSIDPNATTREQFDQHTQEPSCAGCHALIDPLGFPFEHYDAVGRWRDEENGLPIDASGEFSAVSDEMLAGPIDDAVDLATKLAASTDFADCATEQWVTFALGRVPDPDADACSIATAGDVVADSGNITDLLVAIVLTDAFRYRVVDGGQG